MGLLVQNKTGASNDLRRIEFRTCGAIVFWLIVTKKTLICILRHSFLKPFICFRVISFYLKPIICFRLVSFYSVFWLLVQNKTGASNDLRRIEFRTCGAIVFWLIVTKKTLICILRHSFLKPIICFRVISFYLKPIIGF